MVKKIMPSNSYPSVKFVGGSRVVQPPAHYSIPEETGYFPAGADGAEYLVASVEGVTLYRTHPLGDAIPLAFGALELRDPAPGTADDVALVGQCGETMFYVMSDDAATKMSKSEFVLMLPDDCIMIDMTGCSSDGKLQVEALLAARTKFHDESLAEESKEENDGIYPEGLPDDSVSRAMFRLSRQVSQLTVKAGELGASKIDAYGEKKRAAVTETKEVKVGSTSIMLAKSTRTVSEKTHEVVVKVSDKISDVLGGKVGRAAAPKETDSTTKRRARSLLLASAISYEEIGTGAAEGYERMVKSARAQATSFVAEKYGKEAAELARHTTGAAANFGRAALTARRVVNVKKLVKTAVKRRVKEGVKSSI